MSAFTQTLESSTNQNGSIAVSVAFILTLLLGVMAFSIDTGYLFLNKHRYQNALEAAALAGATDLCGDDLEATVRSIAGKKPDFKWQ